MLCMLATQGQTIQQPFDDVSRPDATVHGRKHMCIMQPLTLSMQICRVNEGSSRDSSQSPSSGVYESCSGSRERLLCLCLLGATGGELHVMSA